MSITRTAENEPPQKKPMEDPEITVIQIDDNDVIATSGQVCFPKGTQITMADGTKKNIEDVVVGDRVLSFDHEAGRLTAQEVSLAYKREGRKTAFTLHFEGDNRLSIVGEHCLYEQESGKYVCIYEGEAEQFIGRHFYHAETGKFVELLSVTHETEPVEFFCPYTKYTFNCIADGMLTVPDDVIYMLNLYSFNEGLTADPERLRADIEKYGLFAYPADADCSEQEYAELGAKYLNIVVGKGLATLDEVMDGHGQYLRDR